MRPVLLVVFALALLGFPSCESQDDPPVQLSGDDDDTAVGDDDDATASSDDDDSSAIGVGNDDDATEPPPVDADGDGSFEDVDCDDADPASYPGAPEVCDLIDQDCDSDWIETFDDFDGDLEPDCTDLDDDGDGLADIEELGWDVDGDGAADDDSDGDGFTNDFDLDSDGDGIPDGDEGLTDTDGDGFPETIWDDDGDGIPEFLDTYDDSIVLPVNLMDHIGRMDVLLPWWAEASGSTYGTWETTGLSPRVDHDRWESDGTWLIGWTDNNGNGHITTYT
ncbi:MAG: hypothetical protein GY898_00430 [Proteobacteria bacterium]|nr:hypothetical protein [Pseudomonadota bacterium]